MKKCIAECSCKSFLLIANEPQACIERHMLISIPWQFEAQYSGRKTFPVQPPRQLPTAAVCAADAFNELSNPAFVAFDRRVIAWWPRVRRQVQFGNSKLLTQLAEALLLSPFLRCKLTKLTRVRIPNRSILCTNSLRVPSKLTAGSKSHPAHKPPFRPVLTLKTDLNI